MIAETQGRAGPEAVGRLLSERIGLLEGEFTPELQARRFVHVVGLIAWHEREDFLTPSQVNGLFETAAAILRIHGIPEESSKMSYLHGELRLLRSQLRRKEGRSIEAAWDALLARSVSGRGQLEEGRAALAIGIRAMRRGETRLALAAFADAEAHASDRPTRERARLGRIQLLRLAGRTQEAGEYAAEMAHDEGLSVEARLELEWERMCRKARETGEVLPLVLASSRGGSYRHSSYVIESTIWVKVCSAKGALARVPKVESIRRTFPDNVRRGAPNGRFYDVALRLDRCYDLEIPLVLRLEELGGALAEATRLPTLDKELLVWAAAARWLTRSKQAAHLEFVLAEYRALSSRVTMGASEDALGMLGDLLSPRQERTAGPEMVTSGVGRAASLASLTLAVAGIKLSGRLKRVLGPDRDISELLYSEHTAIARHILSTLGKLRGPLVKFLQFVGPLTGAPEPIRDALAIAYGSLPPLPTIDARTRFEKSVGKRVEDVFAEFEDEPVAAASIGQVHRATLKDGRVVAVKVLYPNIERAIAADFQLVKRIKFLIRWIFPEIDVNAAVAAFEASINEECDLARELAFYEKLYELYRDDPEIVIPRPLPELCSRDILVTEFVNGRGLLEFVQNAAPEERSAVSRIVARFLTGFRWHGIVVADAHPGNVLILDEGRVGFVDFGYSDYYPEERIQAWQSVFHAAMEGRLSDMETGLLTLGYFEAGADAPRLDWERIVTALRTIFAPGLTATLNRQAAEFLARTFTVEGDFRKHVKFDPRELRLLRNIVSLTGLLCELEATNPWGDLLNKYFLGIDDAGSDEATAGRSA